MAVNQRQIFGPGFVVIPLFLFNSAGLWDLKAIACSYRSYVIPISRADFFYLPKKIRDLRGKKYI